MRNIKTNRLHVFSDFSALIHKSVPSLTVLIIVMSADQLHTVKLILASFPNLSGLRLMVVGKVQGLQLIDLPHSVVTFILYNIAESFSSLEEYKNLENEGEVVGYIYNEMLLDNNFSEIIIRSDNLQTLRTNFNVVNMSELPSIETLVLTGQEHLLSLDATLPKLSELSIVDSPLNAVPELGHFPNLSVFKFSCCMLKNLPPNFFSHQKVFSYDLTHNQLTKITIPSGCEAKIDVSHNYIVEIVGNTNRCKYFYNLIRDKKYYYKTEDTHPVFFFDH